MSLDFQNRPFCLTATECTMVHPLSLSKGNIIAKPDLEGREERKGKGGGGGGGGGYQMLPFLTPEKRPVDL